MASKLRRAASRTVGVCSKSFRGAVAGAVPATARPLRYFSGLIEVRVYNRALTPAEIQTDMNTPIQ